MCSELYRCVPHNFLVIDVSVPWVRHMSEIDFSVVTIENYNIRYWFVNSKYGPF